MEKINKLVKLVCLFAFSFVSGVQAMSVAAPLVNCSVSLMCDESANINAETTFNARVERDYDFILADNRGFSGTALDHLFLSFLNVGDRKFENFSGNNSVYDEDPAFNNIADGLSLVEISLAESDYAVAIVDTSVSSAEGSYTESLIAASISPAVLLLGSGVLGLVVITRRKRNDVANTFAPN